MDPEDKAAVPLAALLMVIETGIAPSNLREEHVNELRH